MKKVLAYIAVGLMTTSCLKKIDGIDEMNTNIFDKEYAGDKWFVVDEANLFFNQMGLPRVRVDAHIPAGNMPVLKPYSVLINCSVNGQPEQVVTATIDADGNFEFFYDALTDPSNEYCLSAGIYVEEEEATINTFSECIDL